MAAASLNEIGTSSLLRTQEIARAMRGSTPALAGTRPASAAIACWPRAISASLLAAAR